MRSSPAIGLLRFASRAYDAPATGHSSLRPHAAPAVAAVGSVLGVVRRTAQRGLLATLALALIGATPASATDAAPTRYSLAGGCYSLTSSQGQAATGAEKLRLQATDLGSYLLYRPDAMVLAAQGDGSVVPEESASPAADWRVSEVDNPGTFTLSPQSDPSLFLTVGQGGAPDRFQHGLRGLVHLGGRLLGVPRRPSSTRRASRRRARPTYGEVGGILEGHMHWMTYRVLRRRVPLRAGPGTATASPTRCRTAARSRARRAPPRRFRTSSTTATRPSRTTPPAGRS